MALVQFEALIVDESTGYIMTDIQSSGGKVAAKERTLLKIIVLGCANVGKTSIMERYSRLQLTLRSFSAQLTSNILHSGSPQVNFLDCAGQQ